MANLTNIAPELILEILSHLKFDRATLSQFALVCVKFRPLAQQVLLKYLNLVLDAPVGGGASPCDHLISMLDREPKLRVFPRNLFITWSARGNNVAPQLSALLERLPGLEVLHISTPRKMGRRSIAAELVINAAGFPVHTLTRLAMFRWSGGNITSTAVNEVMKLPAMQYISLQFPPLRYGVEVEFSDRFASLRRLEVGNWEISGQDDTLAALLRKTTSLEVLDVYMGEEGARLALPYQLGLPHNLGPTLEPIRHTLTYLTIDGPRFDMINLDLTGFTSLTTIRALSDLFCCYNRTDRLRDGMHWKLPKSLRVLEVNLHFQSHTFQELTVFELVFMSRRGFFLCAPDPGMSDIRPNPDLEIDWLCQLAVKKPTHFPGLRSVCIGEDVWDDRMRSEKMVAPEKLLSAFEANKVFLQIHFRIVEPNFVHRFGSMRFGSSR
jgi:hypothetical protein